MSPKRHLRGNLAAAMVSLAVGASLAMAQTSPAQTPPSPSASYPTQSNSADASGGSQLSRSDRTFVRKAAEGNAAEVALGRLAEQTSEDPKVKAFGERIVRDHTQANEQLASVAQTLNMTLPTSPSKADQKEMDKLSKLSGTAFDKAFAHDMVKDHRMDIRAFEHEAKDGRDSQVKQFAQTTLPTLREHLALAEQLPGQERRTASAGTTSATESR